ncbi:hypothetical protein BCR44DRAFT_1437553 [Catenaria anguillulae PL171]|uniref:non-specific serine/threonine protein kinase n=1 Tax=Catenaria anguillulae PL171 TaxID=765915 RepID=A0A1Y2HKY9_9FUNG|nr:hypothetical protein BCR44DRAFT_1437553 [Catenaria anguillulae PL171]
MSTGDCNALDSIFQSLDLSRSGPCCTWNGVLCSGGRVVTLYVPHLTPRHTGTIPVELGNLASLETLFLSNSKLSGSIPRELGKLSNLEVLNLANNRLTGPIPAELMNKLSNLQSLDMSYNQLTGPIPIELSKLSKLTRLDLHNNQLFGFIPPELSRLSKLQHLLLSNNQLSGAIPADLGKLSQLQFLFLDQNQLTGPIPADLGMLSNLGSLYLSDNKLSGTIPVELANLSNLEYLNLSNNTLSGSIPRLPNVSILCTISSSSTTSKHCLASTFQKSGKCWKDLEPLSIRDCSATSTGLPEPSTTPTTPTLLSVLASVCFVGLSCFITFRKFHHQIRSTQKRNDPEAQTSRSTAMVDLPPAKPAVMGEGVSASCKPAPQ